jgi:hypothetical protein
MLGNIGAGRREGASPVAGSALSCPASRALSARSSWKTYARDFARHVRATRGRALSHDVAPTAISLPRFRTCRVTARHSKMARDGRGIESVMTATAERAKGRQWAENSPGERRGTFFCFCILCKVGDVRFGRRRQSRFASCRFDHRSPCYPVFRSSSRSDALI